MKFIETICLENAKIRNLGLHVSRFVGTQENFFGKAGAFPDLSNIESAYNSGLFKIRIVYSRQVESIGVAPYEPAKISSLKIVEACAGDYRFKYADRTFIDGLFAKRGLCDDILIVRDGEILDSSYANVVFSDGRDFFAPKTFLLDGTRRRALLASGEIFERDIRAEDIFSFKSAFLVNAMRGLDSRLAIPVGNIER